MAQQFLHKQTIKNKDSICDWYKKKSAQVAVPFYSSYDIRDSGYKVTNVDANIYPAGFNNICPTDKETAVDLVEKYFTLHYAKPIKKIVLVTEEHTQNAFYWENISSLMDMITNSGREVRVAFINPVPEGYTLQSSTGREIPVYSVSGNGGIFPDFNPDLIISNNDFSLSFDEWAGTLQKPMNPPRELGWYQRKKSRYFKFYNQLVNEFCEVAEIDPFLMRVETEIFENFDIGSETSRAELAGRVEHMLTNLKKTYAEKGITQEPFVFVKNNSGTYGLAVIRVGNPQEVKEWSYKSRKKMKAAKGGRDVEEVIIQEGIPSIVQSDGASAEPVIYMLGCELAGGFLRTHAEKDATESLNSPGAVYKKLCVTDLQVKPEGCPMENVYGWSAKLGLLAIGLEAQEMGVQFKEYQKASC
ncbi:MAG: glutamate--cysteine ligase [Bdellovibrionota bacterium]